MLNPYLIQATTLLLTDITASCLISSVLIKIIFGNIIKYKDYYFIFILIYMATMIRPSSLIFIFIVFLLLFIRQLIFHQISYYKTIIAAITSLFVVLPQLYNNVIQFNHWTPLVHQNLYGFQSRLAATYLKYGTVNIPNESAQLIYSTPFKVDPSTTIFQLIFENPIAFLLVYFSHIFGVLDWGYIDTYIKDFYPISRIIGTIFLYNFWIFSFFGFFSYLKNGMKSDQKNFVIISTTIAFMGYLLFISTTVIESRFGYPLMFITIPFAGYGLCQYLKLFLKNTENRINTRKLLKLLSLYIIIMIIGFAFSFLLDNQTGRINWI